MDKTLAIVILMIVAITASVVVTLLTTRARTRARLAELTLQGGAEAETVTKLLTENEQLRGQIAKQEDRLRVLERIATDPAQRIAREIDELQPN